MTLVEFLLARISEDQALAQLVRPHEYLSSRDNSRLQHGREQGYDHVVATSGRILQECEAKRRAVDWYLHDDDTVMGPTVRAMAAVYADHPDYREEWKP